MLGAIVTGLRKMHAACMWDLNVRHRERTVEPVPAWTKCSLASALGQGHLLPGQCWGSPPALAGKSPTLAGAARVSLEMESGKSCRIKDSFL